MTLLRLLLLARPAPRLPDEEWRHLRYAVLVRDDHRCQLRRWWGWGPICGRSEDEMHVDHRVPKAYGGSDDYTNLRAACPDCNLRKGARPPLGWIIRRAARVWGSVAVIAWGAVQISRTTPGAIQRSAASVQHGGSWSVVVAADGRVVADFETHADAERAAAAWDRGRGQLRVVERR